MTRISQHIETFNPEEKECVRELWDDYVNAGIDSPYRFCICRDQENGEVNGFACYGKHPLTESTYDLYWIAVDPARQRTGAGSDLLGYVEKQVAALNGRQLLIETSSTPDYQGARTFYRHHRYRRAAVLRDFYAPGNHLIIYSKTLPNPAITQNLTLPQDNLEFLPDFQLRWDEKRYN